MTLTGWPNSSNTGVRPGTPLIAVPGHITSGAGWTFRNGYVEISGAGTTFSGFRVTGGITVTAARVTVSNNEVIQSGNGWGIGMRPGSSQTLVSHNTVHGPCLRCDNVLVYGIKGDLGGDVAGTNLRVIANNVYWVDHPLQSEGGDWEENYVHDMGSNPANTGHTDCFFSGGSYDWQLTLKHNTLLNDYTGYGTTASIMLNNYAGAQMERTITNNLLGGGGYTVYGGENNTGNPAGSKNVVFTGNKFTTAYWPKSGLYGPTTATLDEGLYGDVWADNTWADGPNAGRPVG